MTEQPFKRNAAEQAKHNAATSAAEMIGSLLHDTFVNSSEMHRCIAEQLEADDAAERDPGLLTEVTKRLVLTRIVADLSHPTEHSLPELRDAIHQTFAVTPSLVLNLSGNEGVEAARTATALCAEAGRDLMALATGLQALGRMLEAVAYKGAVSALRNAVEMFPHKKGDAGKAESLRDLDKALEEDERTFQINEQGVDEYAKQDALADLLGEDATIIVDEEVA